MDSKFVRPTRKDVAKLAGVSETVVSYVINNNRYVSQDKRLRVQEAIKKLNYRPNNIARTLKGKSSNHIVFIADQIVTEHFSLLIRERIHGVSLFQQEYRRICKGDYWTLL